MGTTGSRPEGAELGAEPPDPRVIAGEIVALLGSAREARWIAEEAVAPPPGAPRGAGSSPSRRARELAARRAAGEPLQHVLGHWPFRRLDLVVDARALVPRPETEVVAEVAIEFLRSLARGRRRALVAADLGTGSGAIACSIVDELASTGGLPVRVHATDVSPRALSLAAENVLRTLGSSGAVSLHEGSWFDALPARLCGRLDLVVSNPPYVSESEWAGLPDVVRDHDPYEALVAGPSGTEALGRVLAGAGRWLAPGGVVVVEIAPHQSGECLESATAVGLERAELRFDLAGRGRVLVARRPGRD